MLTCVNSDTQICAFHKQSKLYTDNFPEEKKHLDRENAKSKCTEKGEKNPTSLFSKPDGALVTLYLLNIVSQES